MDRMQQTPATVEKPRKTYVSPRTWAALFLLYAVWGSVFLANRFALESFPPFLLNAARFLTGGVVLYVILRVRGEPPMGPRAWAASFLVGALLFIGGASLLCVGQQWVASGLAATLIATVPLWTVVFAGIWERMPTPLEWAGLVTGVAGVGLMNLEKGVSGNPLGAFVILCAAALWGLGSVLNRRLEVLQRPLGSATEMIAGGVLLLALGLATGERIEWPLTAKAGLGIFHLAIFASVLGFSLYRFLLQTTRPAFATSYALVNPVIAMALGILFAGESLSPVAGAATAVILLGVGLVFRGRKG